MACDIRSHWRHFSTREFSTDSTVRKSRHLNFAWTEVKTLHLRVTNRKVGMITGPSGAGVVAQGSKPPLAALTFHVGELVQIPAARCLVHTEDLNGVPGFGLAQPLKLQPFAK